MRPIIYVSHPFGGDAANVTRVREICKSYARQGIPIAETYADLLAILTSVEKGEPD